MEWCIPLINDQKKKKKNKDSFSKELNETWSDVCCNFRMCQRVAWKFRAGKARDFFTKRNRELFSPTPVETFYVFFSVVLSSSTFVQNPRFKNFSRRLNTPDLVVARVNARVNARDMPDVSFPPEWRSNSTLNEI